MAVADGAGGAGIYSGEWSEYLVSKLPEVPLKSQLELENWLDQEWEFFFNKYKDVSPDNDVRSKFLDEGSMSTLSAVWETRFDTNSSILNYLAIGDSAILIIEPQKGIVNSSIAEIRHFADAPNLLNWKESPAPKSVLCGEWVVDKGSFVTLCTDALSQYLLLTDALAKEASGADTSLNEIRKLPYRLANLLERLEQEGYGQKNWFQDVYLYLLTVSNDADVFRNYLYGLSSKGLLEADDYTLLTGKVI